LEQNASTILQPYQYGALVLATQNASERVMVADIIISDNGQNKTNMNLRATYKYLNLLLVPGNGGTVFGDADDSPADGDGDDSGGPSGSASLYARTSHLNRKVPKGANVGTVDGGVKWRMWPGQVPRTTGGAYVFWW
jgi:hypothetical protein